MPLVYDHFGSLQRMGNDEQLFATMVGYLQQESRRRLRDIDAGLGAEDLPKVERAAHVLKGQISNFGAERACSAAARVEALARGGDAASLPASRNELSESIAELLDALAPWAPAANAQASS